MRRLNVRFLICLIVPLVLVAGGVHLLWAVNVERSTRLILEKAEASIERGDLRQALRLYVDYLKRNPSDTDQICDAAMAAADVVENAGERLSQYDVRSAYQLMTRALRKVPERNDIRKRLIDLLLRSRYFDEALKHIKQLEASNTLNSEMQYQYAICAAQLRDFDEAMNRLNAIVGYDPRERLFDSDKARDASLVKAYVVLAQLLRTREDNYRLADRVMEQLVAANGESAEAHMVLGRYLRGSNTRGDAAERAARLELAHEHLRKSYELAPTDLDVLLENAVLAMEEANYEKANEFLAIARTEHPKDHRVYSLQGRIAILQKDIESAIREYQNGLEQIPDSLDLVWYMFESQLQLNDIENARATIGRMRKLKFPPMRISLAEAHIPLLEKNWLDASVKLEGVRPQLANNPGLALNVNLLLARCHRHLKQTDKELESYRRALLIDKNSQAAARGAIFTLVRLQQYNQAYKLLRNVRLSIGDEEFAKDLRLANALYKVALVLQQRNPNDDRFSTDVADARKFMGQASAAGESKAPEALLLADEQLEDEDVGRAAQTVRNALRKKPDDALLQMAYLRIVIRQKGSADGLKFLMRALERGWKDTAQFRIIRSQLLAEVNPPDVKAKLAELEIGISDYSQTSQFRVWRVLGATYFHLTPRELDSAARCMENAANLKPTDLRVAEILFDVSRDRDDDLGIMAVLNRLRKAFGPQSAEWKLFRAKQLVANYQRDQADRSDLVEAAQIVEELSKVRPSWDMGALLSAKVHDLQGHRERAIAFYDEALMLGPPRPNAVRRQIELLMEDARYKEARLALEHLNPVPKNMVRYKVLLEALGGDQRQALDALSDAIDDDSAEPDDFLWKGRVLSHLKKTDAATEAFVRAAQLAPSSPQTWLMLVEHLVRIGRPRDAENYTREAENNLATDSAPLVLAQAYALLGHHALAAHYYETALAAAPNDPALSRTVAAYYLGTGRRRKAEHYLKKILQLTDSSNPSNSAHAVWARRMLADSLGRESSYLRFRTALALLDANRVGGNLSEVDERLKAELLGGRIEPQFRREGVRILERLKGGSSPLSFEQRMLLARLYDQSGRWSEARDLMIDVISESPKNADVLAQFSDMQLNHREIELANRWINKLVQIAPDSYRTLRLRARMLVRLGDHDEALKLIDAWLPKSLKRNDANRVRQAARLLEELEFVHAAEEKIVTYEKLRLGRSLALAEFMARNGRTDEAFKLSAGRVSKENIQSVARIGILAITRNPINATDVHFQQAREWFDRAKEKNPGDADLVLAWSSALLARGESDEAERILQESLNSNLTTQSRGIVINNLAYVRAIRGSTDADTMRLLDTAAKLIGPHPSVLDSRAMIHLSRGDCAEAISELEDATSFGVDSGVLYFHLALAHQCGSDRSSARRALEEAKEMGFDRQQLGVGEQQRYKKLESWLAL